MDLYCRNVRTFLGFLHVKELIFPNFVRQKESLTVILTRHRFEIGVELKRIKNLLVVIFRYLNFALSNIFQEIF